MLFSINSAIYPFSNPYPFNKEFEKAINNHTGFPDYEYNFFKFHPFGARFNTIITSIVTIDTTPEGENKP